MSWSLINPDYKNGESFMYDVEPKQDFVEVFENVFGVKMEKLGNPDDEEGMFRTLTTKYGIRIDYTTYKNSKDNKMVATLNIMNPKGISSDYKLTGEDLSKKLDIDFEEIK